MKVEKRIRCGCSGKLKKEKFVLYSGHHILYVGLLTSKGPCEQVALNHVGNGLYAASYVIHEKVKGFIYIKYGEEDIPGSPFTASF